MFNINNRRTRLTLFFIMRSKQRFPISNVSQWSPDYGSNECANAPLLFSPFSFLFRLRVKANFPDLRNFSCSRLPSREATGSPSSAKVSLPPFPRKFITINQTDSLTIFARYTSRFFVVTRFSQDEVYFRRPLFPRRETLVRFSPCIRDSTTRKVQEIWSVGVIR